MTEWLLLFILIGLIGAEDSPFLHEVKEDNKTRLMERLMTDVREDKEDQKNNLLRAEDPGNLSGESEEKTTTTRTAGTEDSVNSFVFLLDESEEKQTTTRTTEIENPGIPSGIPSDESEEQTTTTRTTDSTTSIDISTANCNFQRLYSQVSGELKALTEMTKGIGQIIGLFKKRGHKGIEKLSDFMEEPLTEYQDRGEKLKPLVATIKENLPRSSIKIEPDISTCVKVRDSYRTIHDEITATTAKAKEYFDGKRAAPKGHRTAALTVVTSSPDVFKIRGNRIWRETVPIKYRALKTEEDSDSSRADGKSSDDAEESSDGEYDLGGFSEGDINDRGMM